MGLVVENAYDFGELLEDIEASLSEVQDQNRYQVILAFI